MYTRLRPNLVTLVDTFDFHDNELGKNLKYLYFLLNFMSEIDSCLGRYDGQAYEALLERARLNPGNRDKVKT
jgi:hypothetical protein